MNRHLGALALPAFILLAFANPAAAARPLDCSLKLDVPATSQFGETVVMHVSGLTGVGGVDVFTQWRNRVDEAHLFLVPGITEFDFVYRWSIPEDPLPPLEPGHYKVHAIDATGCEALASFRVTR